MNHLIIAPIVLPAVLAGLIVLLARRAMLAQRLIGAVALLALLGLSVVLLRQSGEIPAQAYFLGNWPAPFGIVLVLDRLSALMLVLTAGLAAVIWAYAVVTGWDRRGRHFHTLFLFQMMGLNGAFLTGDAFNLFVFFEVLLIASYGLMVHGGGTARVRAGVQYVAFNLLGSTLFLFGLAAIYSVTGTLNMADLAVKLAVLPPGDAALIRVAFALLLMVFAIKGALVPLHFWLPGTYAAAPGPVAALFAVMTKVGAYAMIRLGTLIVTAPATEGLWQAYLTPAALCTMAVGAIGVLGSHSLPRMVAFAGIGSMGVVFLAIGAGTPQATSAALYYMVHSTLATAALFLLADMITPAQGRDDVQGRGAAASGVMAALFMAAAIAMAGMPPLSGFVAKLLVLDALRDKAALMWSAVLLASLLTILGFVRTGSRLFWKPPTDVSPAPAPDNPGAIAAVVALLAAIVGLTVFAGPITAWLDMTAQALHLPTGYIAANALPGVP